MRRFVDYSVLDFIVFIRSELNGDVISRFFFMAYTVFKIAFPKSGNVHQNSSRLAHSS